MEQGILVGCDQSQEWLLSWWWENYREDNSLPVAFADFGMSEEGRAWCQERGMVFKIQADGLKVALKEEIEADVLKGWDRFISPFWDFRAVWFKKPFALLRTPFHRTLWLDLDCEVLGPLEPVFQYIDPKDGMGLVRVGGLENTENGSLYNSGVIVFAKNSPILQQWVDASLSQNHRFVSDQDVLSQLIFDRKYSVGKVPEIYNWRMNQGVHIGAVIIHWASQWGKEYIRKHGGLKKEMEAFKIR